MRAIIIEDEAITSRRLKNLINEVSSDIDIIEIISSVNWFKRIHSQT